MQLKNGLKADESKRARKAMQHFQNHQTIYQFFSILEESPCVPWA
jgi:arsenate reductase-like glutaredoxin family protein